MAVTQLSELRNDLKLKLCTKKYTDTRGNYIWEFNKPWPTFTEDVYKELCSIIVSFKQNLRVINRMTNHYWHYVNGVKVLSTQTKGDGWSIRKSLHKATVSGAVRLQEKQIVKLAVALKNIHQICDKQKRHYIEKVIQSYHHYEEKTILQYFKDRKYTIDGLDFSKLEIYTIPPKAKWAASRVNIDTTFNQKTIKSITDSGIRAILSRHLTNHHNNPEEAFSPEGIQEMNLHIKDLNLGKDHQPILKVRKYEVMGTKFNIGIRGTKYKKYVEADDGTNLFFAIYEKQDGTKKRTFKTIPLSEAIECQKNHLPVANEKLEDGSKLLFVLSPNDLVCIRRDANAPIEVKNSENLYKVLNFSQGRVYFIPVNVATSIDKTVEYGSHNKIETENDIALKNICYKVTVNRLGIVTKIYS